MKAMFEELSKKNDAMMERTRMQVVGASKRIAKETAEKVVLREIHRIESEHKILEEKRSKELASFVLDLSYQEDEARGLRDQKNTELIEKVKKSLGTLIAEGEFNLMEAITEVKDEAKESKKG